MDGIDLIHYMKQNWNGFFKHRYDGKWNVELEIKSGDTNGVSFYFDYKAVEKVEAAQKENYNVGRKIKALYWWKELIKEINDVKELVEDNSENPSLLKQSTEIRK